jgi:acetoin utilization deacetylase AcuC-like enzyme/GNAT superfamily N-acetyltransferase
MFRIRRIYDDVLPVDRDAVRQVQEILSTTIEGVHPDEVEQLPERLRNPFQERFLNILFVGEKPPGKVLGFALLLHASDLRFAFLDYIASAQGTSGRGVGGALYQRVRDEARDLRVRGLFFESLADDPEICRSSEHSERLEDNADRLRFYESFGARPIAGTSYATPVGPGDDCPPFLVFDDLGTGEPLRRDFARRVVRAVLERKYGDLCTPEYVDRVVASFRDDPVALREPRYVRRPAARPTASRAPGPVRLVVNDRHEIHHVRERGYVEAPVRVSSILNQLEGSGLMQRIEPRSYPESWIEAVHDPGLVDYLRRACAAVPEGKSIYPYIFPIRNAARPPRDLSVQAGYWCIDTFTPIHRNAYPAARRGVDCALTAADEILAGRRFAYALVRPPGHHAERLVFGGFCYFNNAAVAAHFLSAHGRVAILDVDYHHGNGQQDIFWKRDDVLTVSIHGHPAFAYPYFSGFEDELGGGPGEGLNLNLPLEESVDGPAYRRALEEALSRIAAFRPLVLVVALGLDPAKGDPTGTWLLTSRDFAANGRMIGELGLPTLVIQEGGYRTRTLGLNARSFFEGFVAGALRR